MDYRGLYFYRQRVRVINLSRALFPRCFFLLNEFSDVYEKKSEEKSDAVLWNAIGRSNGSIPECTDVKSFLKNVVNCHTFKYFDFNVLAPQIINKRSENFVHLQYYSEQNFYWNLNGFLVTFSTIFACYL